MIRDWEAPRVVELPWVKALEPAGDPFLAPLVPGMPLEVWHVPVRFAAWDPPAALSAAWQADKKRFVAETWQKAPLVQGGHSGCSYSCGEVELAARLRSVGYYAMWISEWSGFPHVDCWKEFCVKRSEFQARSQELWEADQTLRAAAYAVGIDLGSRGGHPDVGATRSGERSIYVEYKGPGDKIKPKQYDWAHALHQDETELRYVAAYGKLG
jgi:hypothetical protein